MRNVGFTDILVFDQVRLVQSNGGIPLRPKAAGVEPHTHTKRHAGNFYGHGKQNGSRARAPYVRPSHFMTFLYEAHFRAASSQWRAENRASLLTSVAKATRVAIK